MGERCYTAASSSRPVPRSSGTPLAYQRAGDLPRARKCATRALGRRSQESRASLSESGRHPRPGGRQPAGSLLPAPLQRVRSPGPADRVPHRLRRFTGDIGPSQKHFPAVLEMEAPEDLRCLARNGLREMAACELKARGPRKNGGLLSAGCTAAVSREVPA